MAIWAIADLHLSFGAPNKSMEVFGPVWKNYSEKIADNWNKVVAPQDLVLLPGDISWAMRLTEAVIDLKWIAALPGTKVMIRGNHDYWWGSASKIRAVLPPSMHIIQNDAFTWKGVSIAGSRLWDLPGASFTAYIKGGEESEKEDEDEKIFAREVERLTLSLKQLDPHATKRIVMTHYPPISADLQDSPISLLLEEYKIEIALFGHLHQVKKELPLFGTKNGIRYLLTAADYLNFMPLQVLA